MASIYDFPDRNETRPSKGIEKEHLSLAVLWNYSTRLSMLSTTELVHVWRCKDCLSVLAVCHTSESRKTWNGAERIA